jgi:hypothetical protein
VPAVRSNNALWVGDLLLPFCKKDTDEAMKFIRESGGTGGGSAGTMLTLSFSEYRFNGVLNIPIPPTLIPRRGVATSARLLRPGHREPSEYQQTGGCPATHHKGPQFHGGRDRTNVSVPVWLGCKIKGPWFNYSMKSHTPECAEIEQFAATLAPLKTYQLCLQDYDSKEYTLMFHGTTLTITQQQFDEGAWQDIVTKALQ